MATLSSAQIPDKYKLLIQNLSQTLTPVQRVSLPLLFAKWVGLVLVSGLIGMTLLHPRPDLLEQLYQVSFCSQMGILILGILIVGYGMFLSGIPGLGRNSTRFLISGMMVCSLWVSVYLIPIAIRYFYKAALSIDSGFMCSIKVLGLSILPLGISLYLIRDLSPTRLRRSGIGLFALASLVGNAVMATVCPAADPIHIVVWHILPVSVMGGIGAWLGKRLLKW